MERPIQAGQSVTFRLPVDTPPEVIAFLNDVQPSKKRSAVLADLVIRMAHECLAPGERVVLRIPDLPADQKEWLHLPATQHTLGVLLLALLRQPASLLSAPAEPNALSEDPEGEREFKVQNEFHRRLAQSNFNEE